MMVAEAEILCKQSISVQYLCVPAAVDKDFFDVSTPAPSPIFHEVCASESVSIGISKSESMYLDVGLPVDQVLSCSTTPQATMESSNKKFVPSLRSGSYTDSGPRRSNEDEHVRIDDLSSQFGFLRKWSVPSAFYAVFDGHGGSAAATYVKNNAMRIFFEDVDFPRTFDFDDAFLTELKNCQRQAYLLADRALADECSISTYCGTTALTALVLGRHLMVANAGDCRAVLCRKGVAIQLSQDHRPTYLAERKRVEDLGGHIEYGYLNGELAVTRALGDWYMKLPFGSASPLTAEPEVQHIMLTEDDEFLIIGCDGIWDVMSNQEAVSLVRRELRHHDDPQECARELVNHALRLDTADNLTAVVVCFAACSQRDFLLLRPRLRCLSLSEEARNKLRSLLEGN